MSSPLSANFIQVLAGVLCLLSLVSGFPVVAFAQHVPTKPADAAPEDLGMRLHREPLITGADIDQRDVQGEMFTKDPKTGARQRFVLKNGDWQQERSNGSSSVPTEKDHPLSSAAGEQSD